MTNEGNSGTTLKSCATAFFVLCLLLVGIPGAIGVVMALKISFLLALAILAGLGVVVFSVYLLSFAIATIGENAENISVLLDLAKSTQDKVNDAISKTPAPSNTLVQSTAEAPQKVEIDPNSWVCSCGKRNDITHTFCPTCGRVPKR